MTLFKRHMGRRVAAVGVAVALLVLGLATPAYAAAPTITAVDADQPARTAARSRSPERTSQPERRPPSTFNGRQCTGVVRSIRRHSARGVRSRRVGDRRWPNVIVHQRRRLQQRGASRSRRDRSACPGVTDLHARRAESVGLLGHDQRDDFIDGDRRCSFNTHHPRRPDERKRDRDHGHRACGGHDRPDPRLHGGRARRPARPTSP